MDERKIGFIQGVAYAASLMKRYDMDTYDLVKASGISEVDFRKYADESDVEILEGSFENQI